ncbi:integrase [Parabacteroides distasonis]|nr:integrase [Parabacteroides distasonis]MCR1852436.1 integrase [Parabacteroides distasonis]
MDIGRSQIYVNGSKEKNGFVPIMGRVAINGTMVRFSSVASELFVFMVKTPIRGMSFRS